MVKTSKEMFLKDPGIGLGRPRPVEAPPGNELHCKGWHQEAALRMLCNNRSDQQSAASHRQRLFESSIEEISLRGPDRVPFVLRYRRTNSFAIRYLRAGYGQDATPSDPARSRRL